MNDFSGDHVVLKDRFAVRRLMLRLPDLIRRAEACGAFETKRYLMLAQAEARRVLARTGGAYDH